MAATKAAKKRTLSPEGRKKIADAQKRRWATGGVKQTAQSSVQQQDQQEDAATTIRRLAGDVNRLQEVVRAHEGCIEDDRETIADYVGILKRELAYHNLRVEEITRDLRLNCIEV